MVVLPSGQETIPLTKEFQEDVGRKTTHIGSDCVVLKPGFHLLPRRILEFAPNIHQFEVRPSDVFVVSSPKTGSTWMQEIVWAMKKNPDLDCPEHDKASYTKCPFFEIDVITAKDYNSDYFDRNGFRHREKPILDSYGELPEPRTFKSHLYFQLFNPNTLEISKFIYMIRDPVDACVSFFHFARSMKSISYPGDLEQFVQDYIDGKLYSGSYVEHLRQWWKMKDHPNIHTVFYENLRKNTMDEFERLNKFLGLGLSSKQLENVNHYTSLAEMKKRDQLDSNIELRREVFNDTADGYFRKGNVGGGQKELTDELVKKLKKHFRDNLREVHLPYSFD